MRSMTSTGRSWTGVELTEFFGCCRTGISRDWASPETAMFLPLRTGSSEQGDHDPARCLPELMAGGAGYCGRRMGSRGGGRRIGSKRERDSVLADKR